MTDSILMPLALIVLLGVLINFHELGHFAAAKLFRIRVEEFAFGLWKRLVRVLKRGDTEYTIHLIPLGGFVKVAGMEPGEHDVPNGFNSKPVWQRLGVVLAGPFMSFLLAYLVFCALGIMVGLPITGDIMNRVDLVMPRSEAERAGLKTGDVIVSINGERIDSGREMLETVHRSANKRLAIIIHRDGRPLLLTATPKPTEVEKGRVIGLLGFSPKQRLQRVGFVESVRYGNRATLVFVTAILKVLPSRELKDAVGGPLSIADATLNSVKRGPYGYAQLMAMLSLSLAIINLLPIPILDGGHILLLLGEVIRGRRLSPNTIELAHRIGITVIAIIFLLIMYLDLNRLATNKLFR